MLILIILLMRKSVLRCAQLRMRSLLIFPKHGNGFAVRPWAKLSVEVELSGQRRYRGEYCIFCQICFCIAIICLAICASSTSQMTVFPYPDPLQTRSTSPRFAITLGVCVHRFSNTPEMRRLRADGDFQRLGDALTGQYRYREAAAAYE